METKAKKYSLYQTFTYNIPVKDLSEIEKTQLKSGVEKLTQHEKNVFLRLILEHAHIVDSYGVDASLPYSGTDAKDGPVFNLDDLPVDLRWILLRFLKVCEGN